MDPAKEKPRDLHNRLDMKLNMRKVKTLVASPNITSHYKERRDIFSDECLQSRQAAEDALKGSH